MILAKNRLNAAWAFHQSGDLDTAESIYRTVVRDFPKKAEAWIYLGMSLNDQCRFEEALAAYGRALRLAPENPSALTNSGLTLAMLNRHEQALGNHRKAITIDPEFARAHTNLAIELLRLGQMRSGWEGYEWRTQTAIFSPPDCKEPFWCGEDLTGKHILVHGEQGLGDEVQTARYISCLANHAAQITLTANEKLIPLFKRSLSACSIIERGTEKNALPRPADYQVCAFNLPRHYGFGCSKAYIEPDVSNRKLWASDLACLPGMKIGINWTGNSQNP